jgi:hypothetical protein
MAFPKPKSLTFSVMLHSSTTPHAKVTVIDQVIPLKIHIDDGIQKPPPGGNPSRSWPFRCERIRANSSAIQRNCVDISIQNCETTNSRSSWLSESSGKKRRCCSDIPGRKMVMRFEMCTSVCLVWLISRSKDDRLDRQDIGRPSRF